LLLWPALASARPQSIVDDASFARYVPSGHLLYLLYGRPVGVFASAFDHVNLRLTGTPVLLKEQVLTDPGSGTIEFAVEGNNTVPLSSRDSRRLASAARRPDGRHIMWQPLDGRPPVADHELQPGVAGDVDAQGRPSHLCRGPADIDRQPQGAAHRRFRFPRAAARLSTVSVYAAGSLTRRALAHICGGRRRPEVFVRPLAGGAPRQIATDGGGQPRWGRDGIELFFRRIGSMMRIPICTTPELQFGKAEKLFEEDYVVGFFDYDVSADGQRFLMVKRADTEWSRVPIHVVLNWFSELERRVPTGR
jgi:hypothetical protein